MTTIPMDPRDFWPLAAAVGLALLTLVILFALSATAGSYRRPAWEDIPESWRGTAIFLGLLWLGLFALTVVAAYVGVWDMIHPAPGTAGQSGLGLGALLAAMLGAPFVIWGTWLKYQTVRFQKEGHMTDRISKAVEQLGAEKTVDRIGRPVTIWRGERYTLSCRVGETHRFETIPRTKIGPMGWSEYFDDETGQVDKDYWRDVKTWQEERTVIQWQGEDISLADGEVVGVEGEWQAFSETVPNIEVRVGAILSLERIAQDSTLHDKGRDHVRVMEILCAYVRENSNAQKPVDFPETEWLPLPEDSTAEAEHERDEARSERFGIHFGVPKVVSWAQTLPKPRADVSLALRVIGRRTAAQRVVEAAWPLSPEATTIWPFDLPCPRLADDSGEAPISEFELMAFRSELEAWKSRVEDYSGYRLDLAGANLQRADLAARRTDGSDAVYSGALLFETRMEGANLAGMRLEGAILSQAHLEGADLSEARLEAAYLQDAGMEGANLWQAQMQSAYCVRARMPGANLSSARLEASDFGWAQLEAVSFFDTRMESVNLSHANLRAATISAARMDGANLFSARMEEASLKHVLLDGANLSFVCADRVLLYQVWLPKSEEQWHSVFLGAAFQSVDLSEADFLSAQIESTFGDASVSLKGGTARPAHWPVWKLPSTGAITFEGEWKEWLTDPAGYVPPPPPEVAPG